MYSQSKVNDFNLRVLAYRIEEDVLVFEVTVNDLLFVNIFHSNCKLGENVLCLLLIQMPLSKRFCII